MTLDPAAAFDRRGRGRRSRHPEAAMSIIASTDLWFPGQRDPLSLDYDGTRPGQQPQPDALRYVVWVDPGRGLGEQAPRTALHLVACRNGDSP
jgi:hypothetical protein